MLIHSARKAEIALLLAKKIGVSDEYADVSDVFSKKFLAIFLKCLDINKHAIYLKSDK